ncbi:MAG: hypothetical protein CO186_04790 [Zetaproteobacteria bacterium CG_4_9_14_3_um_filter_49_83]|nr:MAG: hypothetical protein AUJ56_00545 [Zetaproteobacteria bacterium CG1_02_49_23]PIQ31521.1 MAG: hypothetical protein COW62_09675 [Zetaproteobacteria bacterium CG17_big_fil_post_rev_8_21_14_2_50_50_13]PIV29692.1 MAG: hypothetical protein COS35_10735 [Zetaproteobacteria bacterium CG02_land_8_20_14_3_00_50_9]PIY54600.1 MAG: hypothetical protein COZ00_13690 [Zetaproteobacteria bacterium CG_4_10_14_0_8_um_filter_49_80]PJA35671.1 MAG: hypothetical protein CO186_04790 [Zetaproteobacteria bacterium
MPHHGSATSSSEAWIQAVQASTVITQSGFANHFGFPHAKVIQRYLQQPFTDIMLNTAYGAVIGSWQKDGVQWQYVEGIQTRKSDAALQWVNSHL